MLAVYFWRKGLLVIRTPHVCMREPVMIWRLLSISLEHLRKLLEALARLQPKGTLMFPRYLLALEVLWGPGNISLRLSNGFRY